MGLAEEIARLMLDQGLQATDPSIANLIAGQNPLVQEMPSPVAQEIAFAPNYTDDPNVMNALSEAGIAGNNPNYLQTAVPMFSEHFKQVYNQNIAPWQNPEFQVHPDFGKEPGLYKDLPEMILGQVDPMNGKALEELTTISKLTKNVGRINEVAPELKATIPQELPHELGGPYKQPERLVNIPEDPLVNKMEPIGQANTLKDRVVGDPHAMQIIKWHGNQGRNQSAIHYNGKTGFSIDFSTTCPNKCSGVGPCLYCYVEHPRVENAFKELKMADKGASTSGKAFVEKPYRGELKTWPDSLIKAMNADGGLRMFSFGDYRPNIDTENLRALLSDAEAKGLYIKAITKQPELVHEFGSHPNLRINLSTDYVPADVSRGVRMDEAVKLAQQYPNVRVRGVALNREEAVRMSQDPNIHVVTLYHGLTNFDPQGNRTDKLFKIVTAQNPDAAKRMGGEDKLRAYLDTWENIGSPQSKFRKELLNEYGPKICCGGGKCSRDPTKCGFNGAVTGAVLAGVSLPWFSSED